jgi:hypothetical protein
MSESNNGAKKLFGVVIRGQTYLNMLYLLLAFPLGVLYFVFLVTGLSLGIGLLITWVGFLILLFVMIVWWSFAWFEHKMTGWMLHVDINPMSKTEMLEKNLWKKFKAHISNPVTWKSLAYLFIKFPLGIFSFTVAVTLISLTVGLLSAPFIYRWADMDFYYFTIDTLWQALLVFVVGLVFGLISMHLMNGLAYLYGQFAKVMLGGPKEIKDEGKKVLEDNEEELGDEEGVSGKEE